MGWALGTAGYAAARVWHRTVVYGTSAIHPTAHERMSQQAHVTAQR
jgi:hypothetical protein